MLYREDKYVLINIINYIHFQRSGAAPKFADSNAPRLTKYKRRTRRDKIIIAAVENLNTFKVLNDHSRHAPNASSFLVTLCKHLCTQETPKN